MGHFILRTGGQSGVDRAVLDFAIHYGLPYEGWCPWGGWAEDYPQPPGLLADYPHLQETASPEPEQRTHWNIRDSDATLILVYGSIFNQRSPGTQLTQAIAQDMNRPCLILDIGQREAYLKLQQWCSELVQRFQEQNFCLNIAGPRESEVSGIYQRSYEFLEVLENMGQR
ncbi:putative molybdenum carrier protein [Candidatus Synechococcus calcipolaris G9]|uniref:Molybdenum carrier protein n=1 Tax=Candidatus Synechococcus calcipolaris G9 TaxID=1497997 RepID=A0ABT6F0V4_9SYNE|nr:putative molybdenum carrier protein [Candidatus Synechococcus calcipolaris]MDG2991495.1 putative molybdenum carrier protein [Candidatus Synechococcus calcipolaris G9]